MGRIRTLHTTEDGRRFSCWDEAVKHDREIQMRKITDAAVSDFRKECREIFREQGKLAAHLKN